MGTGADLERPQLDVTLDNGVLELATNQTLGIEHCVDGVHGNLVLSSITNQTLSLSEGHVGRGGAVTLVICNDLNTVILPDTHAAVGGAQINTDGRSLLHHFGGLSEYLGRGDLNPPPVYRVGEGSRHCASPCSKRSL
mmetsp:Transcript_28898/g.63711  ORF Transcript_28898/g.63711 Transcript_28898/m.63711 type:complete len:138 (-) Transcript_28898:56-469(-)